MSSRLRYVLFIEKVVFRRFLSSNMTEENVFNGTVDRYNGITVDTESQMLATDFADNLKSKCDNCHFMTI